jgi:hypothetical protein
MAARAQIVLCLWSFFSECQMNVMDVLFKKTKYKFFQKTYPQKKVARKKAY